MILKTAWHYAWHSVIAGSIATSQFWGPWIDPDLGLILDVHSVWALTKIQRSYTALALYEGEKVVWQSTTGDVFQPITGQGKGRGKMGFVFIIFAALAIHFWKSTEERCVLVCLLSSNIKNHFPESMTPALKHTVKEDTHPKAQSYKSCRLNDLVHVNSSSCRFERIMIVL